MTAGSSAKSVATAINAYTSTSGVTAIPTTTATLSGVAAGAVQFQLTGANATPIIISATVASNSDLGPLAQAINAQSTTTGITATADKTGNLVMTQAEGYDIKLQNMNTAGGLTGATIKGADTGTAPAIGASGSATQNVAIGGSVALNSSNGFTLTSTDATGTFVAGGSSGSTLAPVSGIDVSTAAGATAALQIVDSALASVSSNRAALGAVITVRAHRDG